MNYLIYLIFSILAITNVNAGHGKNIPDSIDLGKHISIEKTITLFKGIPYRVEKHIPVRIEKTVPYPVNVYITKKKITKVPYKVEIPQPYPVEKEVPVPVEVPVHVPRPYPVYKDVPFPVTVYVEKPVPQYVEEPYPVFVKVNSMKMSEDAECTDQNRAVIMGMVGNEIAENPFVNYVENPRQYLM